MSLMSSYRKFSGIRLQPAKKPILLTSHQFIDYQQVLVDDLASGC